MQIKGTVTGHWPNDNNISIDNKTYVSIPAEYMQTINKHDVIDITTKDATVTTVTGKQIPGQLFVKHNSSPVPQSIPGLPSPSTSPLNGYDKSKAIGCTSATVNTMIEAGWIKDEDQLKKSYQEWYDFISDMMNK